MALDVPEKFGRYQVVRELGRGAMGIVYLANDEVLSRTVAIKMIALTGSAQERDMHEGRFRQEARAAGGISHPSIITIYDVGREGDIAYIAMELVEGRELRELIRDGSLDPAQSIELVALVADALGHAHARGIVHRDIKPGNIMVLDDGRIKVMDFGIARLAEPTVKTQTGVLLGSPQYMSPEQVSGQSLDGRADIFSLGVVLYEMLTGVKPFDAPDLTQVLFWVVNMPPKPPSERRPGLPPVVDYIIARALKKNPADRYASAAEFAADLRECVDEVRTAGVAARERAKLEQSSALPTIPQAQMPGEERREVTQGEERVELRASRRFDSAEGMARLAVLPSADDNTKSRGGWTVPVSRTRRRADPARLLMWGAWGLAFIAAILIVVACGASSPRIAKLPGDAVILAFGDSLTFGTGALPDEAWPAVLGQRTGRKVVNRGVPGELSTDGLARLPATLDEVHPQLLILCHGGNDFLRRLDDSVPSGNVRAMVELARAHGVPVILLATPKPGLPPAVPPFYAAIATELRVPFEADVFGKVLFDRGLKSDLVHPNARGYAEVAQAVESLLKKSGAL
jgi:lysophospholipase L1-like esterase/predicted Ser/Thr protein kinase